MNKNTVLEIIPDVEALLAMGPEELAPVLLHLAKRNVQNGVVHLSHIRIFPKSGRLLSNAVVPTSYAEKEKEINVAIGEAWNWLQVQGLLVPGSGINAAHGWLAISRRAQSMSTHADFEQYRAAAAFPKTMLHPTIADQVWLSLTRGDLSLAVFISFRAVEEAVRKAGGYGPTDIGVPLMRRAFDKDNGPLTNKAEPEAEREALAHLFAGAIGSYKKSALTSNGYHHRFKRGSGDGNACLASPADRRFTAGQYSHEPMNGLPCGISRPSW